MGIVNWFTNNIESKERVLTRDLLSMAIADGEFMEEERQEIVRICHIEGISDKGLMNSLRGEDVHIPKTEEDRRKYIVLLIDVMKADNYYSQLELHMLKTLGEKVGVSPMGIVSIITDEIKQGRLQQDIGFNLIDSFSKALIDVEEFQNIKK